MESAIGIQEAAEQVRKTRGLPDYLVARAKDVHRLEEELSILRRVLGQHGDKWHEHRGWFGQVSKTVTHGNMPEAQQEVYRNRIASIEAELEGLHRIAAVIRAGYDPYTVPSKWYAGTVDVPKHDRYRTIEGVEIRGITWQFRAPIPPHALAKLGRAKERGWFCDEFLVAAPDRSLFRAVSSIRVDPVLVGVVQTGWQSPVVSNTWWASKEGWGVHPGLYLENGVSFLIAYWDLAKDLEFMEALPE